METNNIKTCQECRFCSAREPGYLSNCHANPPTVFANESGYVWQARPNVEWDDIACRFFAAKGGV